MDHDPDHLKFKANQTAAAYVAHALDESTQERFEQHSMSCPECVEDVEVWRAIQQELANQVPDVRTTQTPRRTLAPFSDWRMAASWLGVGVLGAAGGWWGRDISTTNFNSTQTVIFNLPAISRGADECTTLRLAPDTELAIIRVPGVARDLRVVALDSEKRELPAGQYGSRIQPDGSQLLRIESQLLIGRAVHLEARGPNGSGEPLGCITADTTR